MVLSDLYTSYADLAAHEMEGRHYQVRVIDRGSPIAVIAPHGGGIEPGTSEIANALAGSLYSLYCFDGLKGDSNDRLHITSIRFDEPRCLELVGHSQVIVSIHGCSEEQPLIYMGGRDASLKSLAAEALQQAGFRTGFDANLAGDHPANICNRGPTGRSLQLEISKSLRLQMFSGMRRLERQNTTPVFHQFVVALQGILRTIEVDLNGQY